jgi:murein DD-endopeptidase MepM/ murein hydrolase activator NlpD
VRAGENLSLIAASHGVSVAAIVDLNDLTEVDHLTIGQVLNIPVAAAAGMTGPARTQSPSSGMIWPVIGQITSYFGPRWGTRHTGLDIAAPTGTEIRAVRAGRVEKAGWWGGYGNCVIINHGDGVRTLYAHASRLLVTRGQRVVQGQVIARVGSTGHSTGPHVHFEVRIDDRFKDPLYFLP